MRISNRTASQGFSAVELLVTLFVAATFLIAGYQLFNFIITDSGNARAEAAASNGAYDYLRRYSDNATLPCTVLTPVSNEKTTIEGVNEPTVTVTITCPKTDTPALSKVEVAVTYGFGSDAQTVRHATFIDKSKGASPSVDVTDGLIGWWQLNGNASSSVGPYDGVVSAATPTTGQNGQPNSAYDFNGTSSYIRIPASTMPKPTTAFSVSAWFKADTIKTNQNIFSSTEAGGWSLRAPHTACSNGIGFYLYTGGAYRIPCSSASQLPTNTWIFVAATYDGSNVRQYVNNNAGVAVATPGQMTWPADANSPLCIGSDLTASSDCLGAPTDYFDGAIDDVRFYSRALSASEVLQLFNGGAK